MTTFDAYPMTIVELEEEAQDCIGNFAAQRLLEVDFVSIDHLAGILASPCQDDECQMVLNHRDHGVRNVLLFFGEASVNVLIKLL